MTIRSGPDRSINLILRHWYSSRLAVIIESILIGFAVGLVVAPFRFLVGRMQTLREAFYAALPGLGYFRLLPLAVGLALLGLFLGWASARRPMIRGSGIPQVKGALERKLSLDWIPELPLKWITSVLAMGSGLSLGREGPSILLGAYAGMATLTLFRRPHTERKILVTAAAAAGMSAAFSAPLAGVLFALEELQSSLTPLFIACALGASMAADAMVEGIFGMGTVFNFAQITRLSLSSYPWVILLGIICALLGDLFKRSLFASLDLYAASPLRQTLRPVLPLLLSIPAGLFLFDITGGGHELIVRLTETATPLRVLLLLLAGKLLFTALCFGSGTSGGIFLPFLSCGALTGVIFAQTLVHLGFPLGGDTLNFMIMGMAGFFAAVVKAPVTGVVLVLELCGNFTHIGSLVLVAFSAFVTSDLLLSRPVYSVLLERATAARPPKPPPQSA